MNILYIPGRYAFCYYYRGHLPAIYSNQTSITEFIRHNGTHFDKARLKEKIQAADVVVMQRPTEPQYVALARIVKGMGKKLIFENDDTYLADKGIVFSKLENDRQRQLAQSMSDNVKEVLAMSDGVIASTQFLADEYAQSNKNVAVLKNCIDPLDEFPCKANTTGKFRVGFIGSVTTNEDYWHIKDEIKKLDERGDVTIVVFGVKYPDGTNLKFMDEDRVFWESLKNVEWQPYVPIPEYMMTVASLALDVVLIPRQDSYFNRCKSNIKFLEMSLLKIPVIAQGFKDNDSPYQLNGDDVYMSVVTDDNAWYDKVVDVKENYSKYKDLANKAHDYVLENYNITKYAPEWTNQIKKLINNK